MQLIRMHGTVSHNYLNKKKSGINIIVIILLIYFLMAQKMLIHPKCYHQFLQYQSLYIEEKILWKIARNKTDLLTTIYIISFWFTKRVFTKISLKLHMWSCWFWYVSINVRSLQHNDDVGKTEREWRKKNDPSSGFREQGNFFFFGSG
jgi:hypothetical protein